MGTFRSLAFRTVVLAIILFTASGTFSPPATVRIGGLFPSFKTSGALSVSGPQRLAGFLMAIKEINANHTILPNTTIKIAVRDTHLSVGKTFFATLDLVTNSFKGLGVDGVIGAATSSESDAASTVLNQFSTVQISYSATSPLLSTKINYPFFARTCPSDAFQGAAMADLVFNHYGWLKVSTFANSDTYGSNGISQFQSSAANFGVTILSSSLFPVGQTNFAVPIADALKTGARIFVFFMAAADAGFLIAQGYAAGLFFEGTQIIVSDAASQAAVWANIPKASVAAAMRGITAFVPAPDYTTPTGSKFLKSFMHQSNTVKDPVTLKCNNRSDDGGGPSPYLFKEALNPSAPNVYNCSGVDFSQFKSDGSNVDNYVSYAYDATYAMAYAMHAVLYQQKLPKITGKALFAALINNVSFVGATGAVNFSHALTSDSTRFAEGDRRTGVIYKILNFQPAVYNADPTGSSGFVAVGMWTVEKSIRFTSAQVYNTADGSPPSDLPPTIILKMKTGYENVLKAIGAILLITSFLFSATMIFFYKTKLIKSIQIRMQLIVMIGAFLGGIRVVVGSLPVTDANCSANVWLGHLAFWFIFCPMMLKTWRVHKIVNNKSFKRVTVTEKSIIIIFSAVILVVILCLAIIQGVHIFTPIKVTVVTVVGIQIYNDDQCSRKSMGFEVFLWVVEAVLFIVTGVLCFLTKHIPGALNEANNNLRALAAVTCAAVVAFPLSSTLTGFEGGTKQVVASLGIFMSVFVTICVLHGWRTMLLLGGYDIDKDHHIAKRRLSTNLTKVSVLTKGSQDGVAPSQYGGSSDMNPFEAVKTKNLLNRRKTCREQVTHWSGLLRNTEMMMLMQADDNRSMTVTNPKDKRDLTPDGTIGDKYKSTSQINCDQQVHQDDSELDSTIKGALAATSGEDLVEMMPIVEKDR